LFCGCCALPRSQFPQVLVIFGAAAACASAYVITHLDRCPHSGRRRVIFQSVEFDKKQGQHAFAQIMRSSAVFPPTRCFSAALAVQLLSCAHLHHEHPPSPSIRYI
jgi:hypothetical protein